MEELKDIENEGKEKKKRNGNNCSFSPTYFLSTIQNNLCLDLMNTAINELVKIAKTG